MTVYKSQLITIGKQVAGKFVNISGVNRTHNERC